MIRYVSKTNGRPEDDFIQMRNHIWILRYFYLYNEMYVLLFITHC